MKVTWGAVAPDPGVEVFWRWKRNWVPVLQRDGTGAFVNLKKVGLSFPDLAQDIDPKDLWLCDRAGVWKATPILNSDGSLPSQSEVAFEWLHCGILDLDGSHDPVWFFRGPDSEPGQRKVQHRIWLRPESGPDLRWNTLDQDLGSWVPPGDYTLFARAPRLQVAEQRVRIQAGSVTEISYHLKARQPSRTIRGWIHPSGGRLPQAREWFYSIRLFLYAGGNSWSSRYSPGPHCGTSMIPGIHDFPPGPIHWTKLDDKDVGQFEYYEVPTGPFSLSIASSGNIGGSRFLRHNVLTSIAGSSDGDQNLNVHTLAALPGPGWGVRRVVADKPTSTDAPKSLFEHRQSKWQVQIRPVDPNQRTVIYAFEDSVRTPLSVAPMPAEWAAVCFEMQPVYGKASDFVEDEDGFLFAEINPKPSWGTRLEVSDPQGTALHDAIVFLNQMPVGRTDGAGEFLLLCDTRPESVSVARDGRVWDWDKTTPSGMAWTPVVLR